MVPVLLSAYAVQIEHFLLSDTLFAFLLTIAVALMMWWPVPPVWTCALTGLLLAAASLVRSQGFPLLIVFLAYVLVRFAGWRTVAGVVVMCAAFAIPVAGYAAWFDSVAWHVPGHLEQRGFPLRPGRHVRRLRQDQAAARRRPLCLNVPASERDCGGYYVWTAVPDPRRARRAVRKARRQARHRASRCARSERSRWPTCRRCRAPFGRASWSTPSTQRGYHPRAGWAQAPERLPVPRGVSKAAAALRGPLLLLRYDPAGPGLPVVRPYAGWVRGYQRFIVVSGALIGVVHAHRPRRPDRGVAPASAAPRCCRGWSAFACW